MNLYSQRDPRWASEKLGKSQSSIGSYGCTITCVSMLAGITPSDTNRRLTEVGGYLGDLIIWKKINEAIPWLDFEWRGYQYDNAKVSQAVANNGGCLVEVDFDGTPSTRGKHWVLFIGDEKMHDPWTGTVEPTSKYNILTGYAVIKKEGNMPDDALQTCLADREKFWKERDELYQLLEVDNQDQAKAEIKRLQAEEAKWKDHECPIVPPTEPEDGFFLNGYQKTYTKDGTTIIENYAIKE